MSEAAPLLRVDDAIAVRVADGDDAAVTKALREASGRHDIHVSRRASGRPRLDPPYGELGVSIAARGGMRVAAFAPKSRIGVDVEIDDPALDAFRLAQDHFSRSEATWVAAWPATQRGDAFLRLWCAKEALLKITGRGVFDGVAEPDLTDIAASLRIDGAVSDVRATADRGPCRVAVQRLETCLIALALER
jgi:4'-phosphopantetheinyl transferase